ncbi:MAG TPA: tetratricopeptide repeat protein, partial [Anaerolineales bacterium]
MPENIMLQEAIEAVRKGQRGRARDLLTRLLRADQANPEYWLWMSAVVDSLKERVYCLQTVLQLDPNNIAARRGLVVLGAQPPEIILESRPLARRQWETPRQAAPGPGGVTGLLANPTGRYLALGGLALVLIGLVLGGTFAFGGGRPAALIPSRTYGPPSTFTPTPTLLPRLNPPSPTPASTFSGPTPLWMGLPATYTPTPLYVSTPHSVSEAFRSGLRAYGGGDWPKALTYFRQASQVEPGAADIQYYIGEAERFMGNAPEAKAAYDQAITINPGFAPSYLGRARARLALNPKEDIANDLQMAVTKDPRFGEAYLDWAAYWLNQGKAEAAINDLSAAEEWLPDSPWVPLYRAQAALLQGRNAAALDYARQANQIDVTLLPAYLTLGQAAIANQEFEAAARALETYVAYVSDNPTAWMVLGQSYLKAGQAEKALAALERALKIDE